VQKKFLRGGVGDPSSTIMAGTTIPPTVKGAGGPITFLAGGL
jgi:hypothetical protein